MSNTTEQTSMSTTDAAAAIATAPASSGSSGSSSGSSNNSSSSTQRPRSQAAEDPTPSTSSSSSRSRKSNPASASMTQLPISSKRSDKRSSSGGSNSGSKRDKASSSTTSITNVPNTSATAAATSATSTSATTTTTTTTPASSSSSTSSTSSTAPPSSSSSSSSTSSTSDTKKDTKKSKSAANATANLINGIAKKLGDAEKAIQPSLTALSTTFYEAFGEMKDGDIDDDAFSPPASRSGSSDELSHHLAPNTASSSSTNALQRTGYKSSSSSESVSSVLRTKSSANSSRSGSPTPPNISTSPPTTSTIAAIASTPAAAAASATVVTSLSGSLPLSGSSSTGSLSQPLSGSSTGASSTAVATVAAANQSIVPSHLEARPRNEKRIATIIPSISLDFLAREDYQPAAGQRGRRPSTSPQPGSPDASPSPSPDVSPRGPDKARLLLPTKPLASSSPEALGGSNSLDVSPSTAVGVTGDSAHSRRGLFLNRHGSNVAPPPETLSSDDEDEEDTRYRRPSLSDDRIKPRPENNKQRLKKFYKRFPDLKEEVPIHTFTCALLVKGALLVQGCLYLCPNYVTFFANVLGKKARVICPFTEICGVSKKRTALVVPNAIEITTKEKSYFWASFIHRDKAFDMIVSGWRRACPDSCNQGKESDEDEEEEVQWNTLPSDKATDLRDLESEVFDTFIAPSSTDKEEDTDPEDLVDFPIISSKCVHEIDTATAPLYSGNYPISVKQFYANFFSEKADPFWRDFHARDGYAEFLTSPWTLSAAGCCHERQVHFRTLTGMSFGPKSTRVAQHQRCRFVDNHFTELVFETSSVSKDVPYSTTFLVESKWTVTATGTNSCVLHIIVCVKFLKKTWLRAMIEKNAIEASREWFESWIKLTRRMAEQNGASSRLFAISDPILTSSSSTTTKNKPTKAAEIEAPPLASSVTPLFPNISPRLTSHFPPNVIDDTPSEYPWWSLWLSTGLGVLAFILFCTTLYFFFQSGSGGSGPAVGTVGVNTVSITASAAELLDLQHRLEEQANKYLFLRAITALAAGREPKANEALADHWRFFKMRGELEHRLADWTARATEILHSLQALTDDLKHFTLPLPTDDADFYDDLEQLLELSKRVSDAKLLQLLTRSTTNQDEHEDDEEPSHTPQSQPSP